MAFQFTTFRNIEQQILNSVNELVLTGPDSFFGYDPAIVSQNVNQFSNVVRSASTTIPATVGNRVSVGGISVAEFSEFMNEYGYSESSLATEISAFPDTVIQNYENFLKGNVSGKAIDVICNGINNPFEGIIDSIEELFSDIADTTFGEAISVFIGNIKTGIQALVRGVISAVDAIAQDILNRLSGLDDLLKNSLDTLIGLPERIYTTVKLGVQRSIDGLRNLFSEENLNNLKASLVNAIKRAVNQFENFTDDLLGLLGFRLCQTTTAIENDFKKRADKVQTQITDIENSHKELKASSDLETVAVVVGGRKVPTANSVAAEVKSRKEKLTKLPSTQNTVGTVNPSGNNTSTGSTVTAPAIISEPNRAILAQKSIHWTVEDVTVNVSGTPARLIEHYNYLYSKKMNTEELTKNAIHLMANILDPLANKYGKENIIILSGMRTVEKAIASGAKRSAHTAMQAVDVRFRNLSFDQYDERINEILSFVPYNRAIAEYVGYYQGPWLHIDIKREEAYGRNNSFKFSYIRRADKSFVTKNPSTGSRYEPGIRDGSFVYSNPKKTF